MSHAPEDLKLLAEAVWPNKKKLYYSNMLLKLDVLDWEYIGPVLIWLHIQVKKYDLSVVSGEDTYSINVASQWVHKLRNIMVEAKPEQAILDAAIMWINRR